MKTLKLFIPPAIFVLSGLIIFSFAQEKKIPESQLPSKVLKTLNQKLPGGEITSITEETEKGELRYDIEKTVNGFKYEIEINADGIIKEYSKEEDENEEECEEEEAEVTGGTVYNFDDLKTGKIAPGWSNHFTGKGRPGKWEVVTDETAPGKPNVFAQVSKENFGYHFSLAVLDNSNYKDLELSVKFKAIEGDEDQGGGSVWRYIDNNNYYIARANPLENNYRVYKVVNGNRKQLKSASFKVPTGEWHTLKIQMKGNLIKCYYDGEEYLEVKDDTFKDAGKIGLWTKADAYTCFDDLKVKSLKRF